jgi:solute:Na+ symporter, SSS family
MLIWFVVAYWIISVGIGLYVATRVHNTKLHHCRAALAVL